jgi:HAD superfamily hydrolase (TIGR01509 family)
MTLDALVFDFDGLILDTEWPEFVTIRDEFVAHGVDLDLDDWRHLVGRTDHAHWSEMLEDAVGGPIDGDAVRLRRRRAHHELIAAEPIRPGVLARLDEADALGVALAVASSSPRDWVVPHLERIGLIDRFAAIVCGDEVARGKPAPDVYLAAADALGAEPARSVALEDSHHGSVAARAAGYWCVVVPNRVTGSGPFPAADLVVVSLDDLDLRRLDRRVAERLSGRTARRAPAPALVDARPPLAAERHEPPH